MDNDRRQQLRGDRDSQRWPSIPVADWQDTRDTLHLYTQVVGKASPVHLFWGALDFAYTRFSGRTAPPHPGGAPNCGPHVMWEAYSHEVSSWAGPARPARKACSTPTPTRSRPATAAAPHRRLTPVSEGASMPHEEIHT